VLTSSVIIFASLYFISTHERSNAKNCFLIFNKPVNMTATKSQGFGILKYSLQQFIYNKSNKIINFVHFCSVLGLSCIGKLEA
jgi:hypothetical protein